MIERVFHGHCTDDKVAISKCMNVVIFIKMSSFEQGFFH